jgi:hypothetical protein
VGSAALKQDEQRSSGGIAPSSRKKGRTVGRMRGGGKASGDDDDGDVMAWGLKAVEATQQRHLERLCVCGVIWIVRRVGTVGRLVRWLAGVCTGTSTSQRSTTARATHWGHGHIQASKIAGVRVGLAEEQLHLLKEESREEARQLLLAGLGLGPKCLCVCQMLCVVQRKCVNPPLLVLLY